MVTGFIPLLDQSEVDVIASKVRLFCQNQGIEPSIDQILYAVEWARSIRKNNVFLTALLMSDDELLDVHIDGLNPNRSSVRVVRLI
jgi:hypothetical protein